MPLVNAYCSVAEVRSQMKDEDSRLDVEVMERAINASSRAVDRWCSGGFATAAPRRFWLDAAPVTKVWAVDDPGVVWTEDFVPTGIILATSTGGGVFGPAWTLGTDFEVEPANAGIAAPGDIATPAACWRIVATGRQRFPLLERGASVQLTARYGWSSIPDEINQATILKSVALFMRKNAPFGIAGVNDFGPVRITRADPDVIDLLTPYLKKRPSRTLTYGAQRYSLFHQGWR